jgi:integrase
MTVISPKTEGHGRGQRVVPMFGRLRPYLEEAWQMAEEGQAHVIPEHLYLPAAKGPKGWINCNLRTQFERIVKRAGLAPWPRLFHALRASCESDLAREFPIATVCQWIGNTVAIAARHYIQATDADFQRALLSGGTTQNPTHAAHVKARRAPSEKAGGPVFPEEYEPLQACTGVQVAGTGFEPATSRL